MELLDISDEILMIICSFLCSADVVALSETCDRLNSLLCEATFARKIHLKADYHLNDSSWNIFLHPTLRRQHINTLNITSCFWLSSKCIYDAVLGLPNLCCLYIQDTQLILEHLFGILKTSGTITRLSWTFNRGGCLQQKSLIDGIRHKLSALEYLNLAGTIDCMGELYTFLLYCCNLKELRLKCVSELAVRGNTDIIQQNFKFLHLHSLVIQFHGFHLYWGNLMSKLLQACNSNIWKIFWINKSTTAPVVLASVDQIQALSAWLNTAHWQQALDSKYVKYLDFRHCRETSEEMNLLNLNLCSSSITHLSWGPGPLPHYLPTDLKHLYVNSEFCRESRKPIAVNRLSPMLNLIRLSVPFCAFLEKFKRGRLQCCTLQDPIFEHVTKDCPQNIAMSTIPKEEEHLNEHESYLNSQSEDRVSCGNDEHANKNLLESDDLCYDCTLKLVKDLAVFQTLLPRPDCQSLQNGESLPALVNKVACIKYENKELDDDDDDDDDDGGDGDGDADEGCSKNEEKEKKKDDNEDDNTFHMNNIYDYFLTQDQKSSTADNYKGSLNNMKCSCLSPHNEFGEQSTNNRKPRLLHSHTSPGKLLDASHLAQFAIRTPNLKELEIRDCNKMCNQLASSEDLSSLQHISYWTKLESLFLEDLPVTNSRFLIEIALSCPKIQRLGLRFVGHNTFHCSITDVVNMVTSLTQLKDFRLQDDGVYSLNRLLKALSKHTKLQRVAIWNHQGYAPSLDDCCSLLEKCKNIVFLYINIKSFTEKMSRDFQQQVHERFLPHRSSLWARIDGADVSSLEHFPALHREEIILNPAQLKIVPPPEE